MLSVENLTIEFLNAPPVVNQVSFSVLSGETFALVGESGSGKSLTALSILGLLPNNAKMHADAIFLGQDNLTQFSEKQLCQVRGKRVGFIFQDPMSSLNPVMTIGNQIAEVIKTHFSLDKDEIHQRVLELLEQVEIPNYQQRIHDYPHQLSGGQRQRVMIAMALAGKPELLIADEPTTALDVTIQAQILALLKKIQQQSNMALWLISHDLALVSTIAHRVAVMQKGTIVEMGEIQTIFNHPSHAYTKKLLAALPNINHCLNRDIVENSTLLNVKRFSCHYPIRKGIFKRVVDYVKAVDDVSFELQKGKTLALVGESGCGKTTLGKALLNLIPNNFGHVFLNNVSLQNLKGEALRQQRAQMQIVFQDPFASMNPRLLVGDIIAEGLTALKPDLTEFERIEKVNALLKQVNLPIESALRYPHEFSGGQRQRICIARALAVEPKLLICDEPTSALDVSVQAQIIQLLKNLQQKQELSYLFITHDLAVVAEIADDVAVMFKGKIIEYGHVEQILFNPQHDYTKKLLSAAPILKR